MLWSQSFIPTTKEDPIGAEAVSHKLLLRAGLVNMLTSGVYSYLPLGLRVLRRIENIIREEMNATGAQELFLPVLQPIDLWKKTGRDKTLADVMIRYEDKRGRPMCLGPTHEEVITELVKNYIQSYRQLPLVLYQIQTKFRDEMRPRFGVIRACEFIMKDAYSFDRDKKGLDKNYKLMFEAYKNIFKRCDLNTTIVEADPGAMGGDESREFLVQAPIGEDTITDESGKKQPAIELGHIFKLGTKYSAAQGAQFLDEDGKQQTIIMGCYGIGVSRLISAIIEVHNDKDGIVWPREVSPFDVEILPLQMNEDNVEDLAKQYACDFEHMGLDVLVDDRDDSAGRKFKDADLIGIPFHVIIGKRLLKEGKVEIKNRKTGKVTTVNKNKVKEELHKVIKSN